MKKYPLGCSGEHVELVISEDKTIKITRIESENRYAYLLKNSARFMAKRSKECVEGLWYEKHAYITGAIILSYSFLEAAFNEFIYITALSKKSPLNTEDKAIIKAIAEEELFPKSNKTTPELFNLILRLLNKQEMSKGEEPYQSVNIVCQLRNMLVHPKPERIVTFTADPMVKLSEQQKIVKDLRSHLHLDENATFPKDVLNSDCAQWAVASTEEFFREFVVRSGVDPGFITEETWPRPYKSK